MKHAVNTERKQLVFQLPNRGSISYPLYNLEKLGDDGVIEALIDSNPSQDHMMLIGLPHARYSKTNSDLGKAILSVVSPFILNLKAGIFQIDSLSTKNQRTLETYKENIDHIQELLTMIPNLDFPNLSENPRNLLEVVEDYEKRDFCVIVSRIKESLIRIDLYLTYKTSKISKENRNVMSDISKYKIPKIWLEKGPYNPLTNFTAKE